MSHIFYISSWGGSATLWLSEMLNQHPAIRCFHGSRAIPSDGPGKKSKEATPSEYTEFLLRQWHPETFVGAIHGYHGLAIKEPVCSADGAFCGIIRQPVLRIQSLFAHHTEKQALLQMTHRFIKWAHNGFQEIFALAEKKFNKSVTLSEIILVWIAVNTFYYDMQIHQAGVRLFKMETLTTQPDEFNALLNHLTKGELKGDDAYLASVFKSEKMNKHAKHPMHPDQIILSMDEAKGYLLRLALEAAAGMLNMDAGRFYADYAYDLGLLLKPR